MAHALTPAPAAATPISTRSTKKKTHFAPLGFQRVWACHQASNEALHDGIVYRRTFTLGLAGAVLGLNISDQSASAAARRPPPPPPEEKRDPNMSGVQAKVLASKRRKEAMKEAMTKQREKGKPVN
ncbi:hypothetical protein L1049_016195 [Liquidambar formosana]|uniref:Uncharacterized protein n=1 Tax=Liquidambar formosana TaxID=63359 RepID=A0AAP0X767_LIQFO